MHVCLSVCIHGLGAPRILEIIEILHQITIIFVDLGTGKRAICIIMIRCMTEFINEGRL